MMAAEPIERPRPAHVPVMPDEVTKALAPVAGGIYADVTLGAGGHSAALLLACPGARIVAFDRDPAALALAGRRLGERATLVHAAFSELCERATALGIEQVDGLIADLGLSSMQLENSARGMSFRLEGPLDMRMDPTRGETAAEMIARLEQDELADVIYQLGEERRSRRIARCIKRALEEGELTTTLDLRRAVVRAVGPRHIGGVDPATRTFQALRMAVNHELDELDALLGAAARLVRPGGSAVFISFHSLEDRKVKRALLDATLWERLTHKPLTATPDELERNARARSAKLRAARRVSDDFRGAPS